MKPKYYFGWAVALSLGFAPVGKAAPATINTIEANNNLGFKIISEASKLDKEPKNRFVSPLSAHVALSMTLNGTNNVTRDQMMKVLGYPLTANLAEINQQNFGLVNALFKAPLTEAERANRSERGGLPPVFTIQNSTWTTNGGLHPERRYEFNTEFFKDLTSYYHVGDAQSLDFEKDSSAEVINEWTRVATQGLVPKIIDSKTLKELLWVFINTTYLEAQWERPFFKTNDKLEFRRLDGQAVRVPRMVRAAEMPFGQFSDFTIVELGMNESKMKAYVVVPKTMLAFTRLQKGRNRIWSQEFWDRALSNMVPQHVRLEMTPFTIADEVLLLKDQPLTQNLGLNFLFQDETDLTRMDAPGVPLSKVGIIKQSTKVEWTEKGIKAVAATIVGGSERTSAPSRWLNLTVNKPFYFAIYDQDSKTFLFLGQVVDPLQK